MKQTDRIIHISYAKIDFSCPYCDKEYNDEDGKYYDRCANNKHFITSIKCECENRFGFTYDITGQAVGFKL